MMDENIASFEKEIDLVHHDLRLTPEFLARVQVLLQKLADLKKYMM